MSQFSKRLGISIGGLVVLSVLALQVLGVGSAAAGGRSDRVEREVQVMEKVIDAMLVDSPNWLVRGHDVTRGRYLKGKGAMFSFRASLVEGEHHDGNWWRFWNDHDRVIILDDDDDGDYRGSSSKRRERSMSRSKRRYERGRDEVVEALAEFGHLLTSVADDEWVEVEARLRDADYFDEADLRRLRVKARMQDLRSYMDERLDWEDLLERIEIDES